MQTYLIVILSLVTNLIFCQNEFASKISQDANQMIKGFTNDDFESLVTFTYPKIIEMSGGKELMTTAIKDGLLKMKQDGFSFIDVKVGAPQKIYPAGAEMHCLVPQTLIMQTPQGKIKNESYLLGVSRDNGQSWTFVDCAQLNSRTIPLIFLDFNNDLKIPEKTPPVKL